ASQVAFTWNGEKQDQFDIYVKPIGAEPLCRLTFDPDNELHLQWSPNGEWIAFAQVTSQPPQSTLATGGLYLIPASGGPKRQVGQILDAITPNVRPFAWTADGKSLIVARAFGGTVDAGLFRQPLEAGTSSRTLTQPPLGTWDSDPALSPDGRN